MFLLKGVQNYVKKQGKLLDPINLILPISFPSLLMKIVDPRYYVSNQIKRERKTMDNRTDQIQNLGKARKVSGFKL